MPLASLSARWLACCLLAGAATLTLPALAEPAAPPVPVFSAGTANDAFDVLGTGPWKIAGSEAEAPTAPDATWRPHVLEKGGFLSSDKLVALDPRARLLPGSAIMGGDRGQPVWVAFGTGAGAAPLPSSRIVLCPPSEAPVVSRCVSAARLEARLLGRPAGDPAARLARWSDALPLVDLRLMPGMKPDKVIRVLDAAQRDAIAARWEAIHRDTQLASAERDRRQAHEEAERQAAYHAREAAARAEFQSAPAGQVVMCDTGTRVLEPGFQLAAVTVACATSNGHRLFVRVAEALQAGWAIDNQVVTPITNVIGGNGFSINLVLRKR